MFAQTNQSGTTGLGIFCSRWRWHIHRLKRKGHEENQGKNAHGLNCIKKPQRYSKKNLPSLPHINLLVPGPLRGLAPNNTQRL